MSIKHGICKSLMTILFRAYTSSNVALYGRSPIFDCVLYKRPAIVASSYGNKSTLLNNKENEKSKREYSSHGNSSQFPNIMDFPVVMWPNLFKSIRNWIIANFIIARYFDKEFSLKEFIAGSKKALDVVSHYLAKGDLNSLTGLVTPEAIKEVNQHLYRFSLRQQSELAICEDDIFFCFPYEIGIMFDNEDLGKDTPQRRYVEITMCYHVLTGLKEMRDNDESPPFNFGYLPEFRDKIFIINYRFFRDFTEGVEANWIINGLNHLKPIEDVSL